MGGKANPEQLELLLDYMERHSEFAAGRFLGPNGAKTSKQLWLKLTGRLNELGTTKDCQQWQRIWCALKRNARSRYAERKKALTATGNRKPAPILNSNDEKIISIIGTQFAGLQSVKEDGVPQNRAAENAKSFHTANLDDSTNGKNSRKVYAKRILEGELMSDSHGSNREKRRALMSGIRNALHQQKFARKSQMVMASSNSALLKACEDRDKMLKEVIEKTLQLDKSVQNVAATVRIECEKIVEAIYEVATTKLNVLIEALTNEHVESTDIVHEGSSLGRLIADDAT